MYRLYQAPVLDPREYKPQGQRPCPYCDRRGWGRKAKGSSATAYIGRRCRLWLCVCPQHGVIRQKTW